MISVKIYCMKTHREYENVYMVIPAPHIVSAAYRYQQPRCFCPPLSAAGGSRGNLEKNEVDKMKSEIYTAICKK